MWHIGFLFFYVVFGFSVVNGLDHPNPTLFSEIFVLLASVGFILTYGFHALYSKS